ncbi:MAG TPA: hypothetical protein VMD08_17980 [Candidatus Baltobacteraceae bacterium]|nr:hypothetical protein [Candidatus Baltobacteraceae bacterium]
MTEAVAFPALEPCEEALDDLSEWYYRQIHPTRVSDGTVDAEAFTPSQRDERKLSGVRSSKQTARGAYEEYRRDFPNNPTAGTWGVTLEQVAKAKGRLVDDSQCPPPPGLASWPTGHTYLDQRINDRGIRSKMRLTLARDATNNGCQHAASG